MTIIAHRGLWKTDSDKNRISSLIDAIRNDCGIETDIRDYKGRLVISHNPADDNSEDFADFLKEYQALNSDCPLALNIKADGIQGMIKEQLEKYNIVNYFFFDMSVPEQVVYLEPSWNFNVFGRHSDIEQDVVMYDKVVGIWMDEFFASWINSDAINFHLNNGKKVGIISPEIHKRDPMPLWNEIKKIGIDKIMLCTDKPLEAKEFFKK